MRLFKKILRIFLIVLLVLLMVVVWYAWYAFPMISGFAAKNMCSAIYLQHRSTTSVQQEDLGDFPMSLASFRVNKNDSSVTASVWGFAKKKAIYRAGVESTLVNDFTETEIRKQHFEIPAIPLSNRDSIPWPSGDKVKDTILPAAGKALLDKAVSNVMNESNNSVPAYTRAVLVIHDGKIVAEKYADGFGKNSVMLGWSMTKSITGALIGVLVNQGKLSVNDPAPIPAWINTDKQQLRLVHLLQQTSGLDFEEVYIYPSEVTNMLFNKGDMAAFTAALPLKHPPGTVFNYSSGNSNILSRIIRNVVGEKDYTGFPYHNLFHKINAYSFLLEPDASGTYVGSSYGYATARDFARFGLLYYNNGVWNGQQILPVDWVKESVQPTASDKDSSYGYQFWLNGFQSKDHSRRVYPDAPADMYYADGYGGQYIFIIPSQKLIIVRLGVHKIDGNKLIKEIIASLKQ
jgi:CubicO group peptidase (beta-lactamase class C family)